MAKKSPKKNSKKVLAFDLGGTKIAAAAVDARGKILSEKRERADFSGGPQSLIAQMARMGSELKSQYKLKTGAIASAGPLDPRAGTLLNPTNFKTSGQSWGVVKLVAELKKKLKIPLTLENDAAAAALAEHWVGISKSTENLVSVTLGTGIGVGVIANGELLRSGRHLHPELGHITLDYNDREHLCGCGNYGCAEALISGVNFTKAVAKSWHENSLTGERLVQLARAGDERALQVFRIYSARLAFFFYSLCVMFSPEVIVISGGFSNAHDLFLPDSELRLNELMRGRRVGKDLLPQIKVSKFTDEAGLLGAAYVALQ